jgi:peptidoglycan LD-endopeptidase LytH
MQKPSNKIFPVLGRESVGKFTTLDLSRGDIFEKEEDMVSFILSRISQAGSNSLEEDFIPFGGYLEERSIYQTSEHFGIENPRNIHLGIDLWVDAGTPVFAANDGVIHSFAYNNNYLDYGYTLIIFYPGLGHVLYGHLADPKDTFVWEEEKLVKQGENIALVGPKNENGGWIPHLHLQFITKIGNYSGDFPGVCSKKDMLYFSQICPDPSFLLK